MNIYSKFYIKLGMDIKYPFLGPLTALKESQRLSHSDASLYYKSHST